MYSKNINFLLLGLVVFLFIVIIGLTYTLFTLSDANEASDKKLKDQIPQTEQERTDGSPQNMKNANGSKSASSTANNNAPKNTNTASTQNQPKEETSKHVQRYESNQEGNAMVLYRVFTDRTREKTGLSVAYDWNKSYKVDVNIVVSPDGKKAVFNKWGSNNPAMYLYVADINGKNVRELAVQEIPEGSGSLNTDSIAWTPDSQYVTYEETGVACAGDCENPDDFAPQIVIYQVNVVTGTKLLISKSTIPQ